MQRNRKKLVVGLRWKDPANGSGGIRVNITPSPNGICIAQVQFVLSKYTKEMQSMKVQAW